MKKLLFFLIITGLAISFSACRPETQEPPAESWKQPEYTWSQDEYLYSNPVGAILDDTVGLEDGLTDGEIIFIRKIFNPGQEFLSYEIIYQPIESISLFMENVESLFEMSFKKHTEEHYGASQGQYVVDVWFEDNQRAALHFTIRNISPYLIFPFIDNEYPDHAIPNFPDDLNVYGAIRGISYEKSEQTLRFIRQWPATQSGHELFMGHYRNVYEGEYEEVEDDQAKTITYFANYDDQFSVEIESKFLEEDDYLMSVVIVYHGAFLENKN